MEQTPSITTVSAEEGGIGKVGIVLIILIVIFGGVMLYYVLGAKENSILPPDGRKDDDKLDDKLPKTGGDKAVGLLTDPNFFNGLTSFANTIYGMVQQGKKKNQNQTPDYGAGTPYGPKTEQDAKNSWLVSPSGTWA